MKVTASFTFHEREFQDVEVINPGGWFGKTWLLEIGVGFSSFAYVVEAGSESDAIDELVDSRHGEYLIIDEPDYADYGIGTDNPTCSFAGNDGRPVCLDDLHIHGPIDCHYHVDGATFTAKDFSDCQHGVRLPATVARVWFEKKTRNDGSEFWSLKDDRPEWVYELVHSAHGDMLPDDWRYEAIVDTLDGLSEDEDWEPEADILTRDLFAWLGSRADRYSYVDEAVEDFGHGKSIVDDLQQGQLRERDEVLASVRESLEGIEL